MKGLLAILTLSCLAHLGSGIICHQCQYYKCRDKYNNDEKNLGDCGDDMYCVKYKTIVWIQESGEITGNRRESHVVTRSCESKKGQKEGCNSWQNNGGITLKCWCGSDGCNGGRSLKPVLLPVVLIFVMGFLVKTFTVNH